VAWYIPSCGAASFSASFQQRVRTLSHNSALHLPISLRLRILRITRQCWNRMADGSDAWTILEEARTKLLVGPLPQGMSPHVEVNERVSLWEAGRFEELLSRLEQTAAPDNQRAPAAEDRTQRRRTLTVGKSARSECDTPLPRELTEKLLLMRLRPFCTSALKKTCASQRN